MAVPEELAARRAALLLHSLPAAARHAVMSELTHSETARLQPWLGELQELGIAPELGEALQSTALELPRVVPVVSLSARERVCQLDARMVLDCLAPCGDATVAWFLCAERWPWRTEVLELMLDGRRDAVLDYMDTNPPPMAPAVLASLCEGLCEQAAMLAAEPAMPWREDGSASRRSGRFAGFLKRVFAWKR